MACGDNQPVVSPTPDSGGSDPDSTIVVDSAPDATSPDLLALFSAAPIPAVTGELVWLEGTFATPTMMSFPGGASIAATVLGAHRATVAVPSLATTGGLIAVGSGP